MEKETHMEADPDARTPGPLDFAAWDARQRYYTTRELHDGTGAEYFNAYMGELSEQICKGYLVDEPAERVAILYPAVQKALAQSVWPGAAGEWQMAANIERLTGAMTRMGDLAGAAALIGRYFELPELYKARSTATTETVLAKRAASCQRRLS